MNRKIQISKLMYTETGHRLTDYSGKCNTIHGHGFKWEVTVTAPELNNIGFIMDYADLKMAMQETVDQVDHAFLMHDQDPMVLEYGIEGTHVLLKDTAGNKPRLFILPFNPTSENIIEWMAIQLIMFLPKNVKLTHIRLWETAGSYCDWSTE